MNKKLLKKCDYEIWKSNKKVPSIDFLHTDNIERTDLSVKDLHEDQVMCYGLVNEKEYNNTIMINSSEQADFEEWYEDKNAKVLIIVVEA